MPDYTQQQFEYLQAMRDFSASGGALGPLATEDMNQMMSALGIQKRKRLSPEEIHNLGVLYGAPLSQARIKYFEDQRNRDPNQSYYGKFPEFPD
jgi:hypothetical protein